MNDYTFTITTTLSGDTRQEAWDQWADLLTQPRFVEDYTVVRTHEYDDDIEAEHVQVITALDVEQVLAVDRCIHCGKAVHNEMFDGYTFIIDDETGGDVCGWDGGDEPHEVDEPSDHHAG